MKFLITILLLLPLELLALDLQIETGLSWQHRNDVKISPKSGSLVTFDEFDSGPFYHYRFGFNHQFSAKHGLRIVFAPLNISVTGKSNSTIIFNEQTYNANENLTVNYKFNSYRLGYTYTLLDKNNSIFKLGITTKIRDAKITFTQNSTSSTYDNLGFVPLFYYAFQVPISQRLSLFSDGDFAAAKQGRAFDLTLKMKYQKSKHSQIGVGIRGLEGGAENDKVYTFSFLTYAIVDYTYSF